MRISTPKAWPFNATIGAFYQWQKKEINEDYSIAGLSQSVDGAQYALRRDAYYLTEVDKTNYDYALFGEGTYEIVSKLKLTGGIRLFRAKSRSQGWEGVGGGPGCTVPFTGPRLLACDNVSQYYDSNGVLQKVAPYDQSGETHKVSVSYQVQPNKMVYATYSTGFRPGGPNTIAPKNPYKADKLTNFEVGFKTGWGRNFRLNGAAYYEKWDGLQYFIVPSGYNGNGLSFNAANARVLGVESDFDWKIGALSLSGSASYNDAVTTTDFCTLTAPNAVTLYTNCAGDPTKTAAPKGTRLPRQPKFKGQAQARYNFTVAGLESFGQFALEHQSSSTSNLDQTKDALLGDTPSFTTVDFSTGFSKDKWSVELFVQNIFDTRGQLSRNTFCAIEVCANSTRTLPSRPRFIGLKFSNKF